MLSTRLTSDGTLEITATGCICEYEAPENPYDIPEDQFSANDLRGALSWYGDQAKSIKLFLNSPGGSINQGIESMNLLALQKIPKICVVTALAASAATLLPLACDEVIMLPGSRQFLHMPLTEVEGSANADDLRSEADRLDQRAKQLAGLFVKTGKTVEEMIALMSANTWLTPEECVAMNLATSAPAVGASDTAKKKASKDRMKLPGMSDVMRAKLDPLSFVFDTLGIESLDTLKTFRAEVDTMKAERDALSSERDTLKAEHSQFKADLDTAKSSVHSLTEQVTGITKERDDLKASIPLEVAKIVKAAALPAPINTSVIKTSDARMEVKRSAFDKMSHKERDAFIKSGGKVKD